MSPQEQVRNIIRECVDVLQDMDQGEDVNDALLRLIEMAGNLQRDYVRDMERAIDRRFTAPLYIAWERDA